MMTAERLAYWAVIGGLLLAMLRTHRLKNLMDGLRKTMNEAIVHDLKNPLTSIMGCLSVLSSDTLDEMHSNKLIAIALHSCRSQLALLETLIDTNRLETGEIVLHRRSLSLAALLRECLDGVRGTAASLGVTLEEHVSDNLPDRIGVDSDLFPRVILNILHNALKYTPAGGRVVLSAESNGEDFGFTIHDTGIGIPRAHIDRLFEKYYRVEGGDQTSRRGSGLGLYFCRLVVEAHGGEIGVASDVGRGTTISISIPKNTNRSTL